jgi:O-6-methylguanine DNA methyltransferase
MQTQKNLTPFQLSVYKELLKIPAGETRTYKQIAKAIGKPKAARAVGNACNKNPFAPAVPCHRVVGSNGKLTGYAFGLPFKKKLLELEAAKQSTKKVISDLEEKLERKLTTKVPSQLK